MTLTKTEQKLILELDNIINRFNYTNDRLEAFSELGFNIIHYFDVCKQYHKYKSTDEYLISNSEMSLILWVNNIDGVIILYQLSENGDNIIDKDALLDIGDNNHCKFALDQDRFLFYRNHQDMKNLYIQLEDEQQIYNKIDTWGD